ELTVSDHQCFFTMELIEGVDFLHYVGAESGDDPRPPSQTVDMVRLHAVLRQLVTGLAALHGRGVVHRDVKPTNVLVESSGPVVLLAFGVAGAHAARRARTETFAGPPAYMAPELLFSGAAPSPATDWYSVGAMVYEALTGAVPYPGALLERARTP